jgi:sortase A
MRVLLAEPKSRAKPMTPFSVDPTNLLALYAIRQHQPRVDLGEVRLREPAVDLVGGVRKQQVAAALGEYALRRIAAESTSRRRAKRLLRWTQRLLLLLGLLLVGTWGWFYTEAKFSQVYQGWRLDQLVKHRPAEVKSLIESYLAKLGIDATNGTPPPVAVPAPTKSLPPGPLPPPAEGALIGRVEIPRLALSAVVLEGDSDRVLREAVGHIPGTALPGAAGNVAIAGHRDTFFRALRNIHRDDDIALETTAGTYHYRVDSTDIVGPKDIQVLKPSDQPSLTLITCYPFSYVGSAPERYIVHARQIGPSMESSPMVPPGSAPKPVAEAGSRALKKSLWQTRSAHRTKLARQVARRLTRNRAQGVAATSRDRRVFTETGNDPAAAALSDPPANTHKPSGLRRGALTIKKRFASWFRSHPNRTPTSS